MTLADETTGLDSSNVLEVKTYVSLNVSDVCFECLEHQWRTFLFEYWVSKVRPRLISDKQA